jgi:hypothetical protein
MIKALTTEGVEGSQMEQALAGHGDEAQSTSLPQLMPHELGMLVAGLIVLILILCALLCLALYRIAGLKRRLASMTADRPTPRTPPGPGSSP